MAIFEVEQGGNALVRTRAGFDEIWRHYLRSGFIYDAKAERLAPVLELVRDGWPLLEAAPPDVFRMHVARDNGRIVSSGGGFRDGAETYVLQHAVSGSCPWLMLQCIRSLVESLGEDPDAQFFGIYFRPE